ncbi:MAG: AAA family ATPase [Chloroflexi bacterium]|nr:AAA family ATPase [Chloroflexota bacterium]
MTTTIALAGKGGVGKTTVAGMVIKYLAQNQTGSILAIDADPSSNLNMVLGLELDFTVGEIREDMLHQVKESLLQGGAAMGGLPGGISKREYLEYHVRSSLAEGARFDLIAMGRGEGQGCYCAVNHNLREVIDGMSKHYAYVVIDNEAGMEHLSRRTTRDVQHLLIISDPSQRGLVAAQRIADMSKELDVRIEKSYLIINRLQGKLMAEAGSFVEKLGIPLLGTIAADDELAAFDYSGRPLVELSDASPVYQAVSEMLRKIL